MSPPRYSGALSPELAQLSSQYVSIVPEEISTEVREEILDAPHTLDAPHLRNHTRPAAPSRLWRWLRPKSRQVLDGGPAQPGSYPL